MTNSPEAVLLAAKAPSPEQQAKLEEFLSRRYGTVIRLVRYSPNNQNRDLVAPGNLGNGRSLHLRAASLESINQPLFFLLI